MAVPLEVGEVLRMVSVEEVEELKEEVPEERQDSRRR
jgi:hypothetical protein